MTTTIPRSLAPVRQQLDNVAIVTAKESRATPTVAIHAGFAPGAVLYPVHPYALPSRGTVANVEQMPEQALRDFHRARFAPRSCALAMVGDIEPARAIEQAARVFGGWKAPAPPSPVFPPVTPPTSRQRLVIPMMNKAQADIAYGFVAILRSDPAYYAYWLMNNILGQFSLGGRLGDSIRERQGMAYYVFSALDANIVPGPLAVRAGV